MASDERPFGLPDAAFWEDMWANEQAVLDQAYLTTRALIADGPRAVDLARRDSVPVGVLHYAPTLHHARAPYANHALVVALRAEDGLLVAGGAAQRLTTVPAVPPGLKEEDGHSVFRRAVDLFVRPGVPRGPGSWHVWFVLGDLVSNRVVVDLVGERPFAPAPLARDPWPAPGDPWPAYDVAAPPAPPRGVSLEAPPRARLARGATGEVAAEGPIVVRGAARLAWPPAGAAPPPPGEPVCVPLSLLVTGSLRRGPTVLALQVPAREVEPGVAEATFAVDLASFLEVPTDAAQTLHVFAFAPGGHMTGPAAVELLLEEGE
ncbi:MAG: hypothetical protein M9894_04780 [Planctomycetes bacterium]|nr:hypothetical protein [Planctomycetota bacterium]